MTKRKNPKAAPSRRDFLTKSATAAGVLAAGATASGGERFGHHDNVVPSSKPRLALKDGEPIRMAIIGPGGMGSGHMRSTVGQNKNGEEKVHIVALAEVCKPRLDKALGWLKDNQEGVDVKGYRSYTEMLEKEDLHCVLIASPEHWHAQMAVDVIASGRDAYCEKPMTKRIEDAFWMMDTMRKNPDMRLQVGTQYMMQEKYHAAKKLIAEGAIGKPIFSQTSYCRNSMDGEWLYGIDKDVKPGEMLDWKAWCGPLGEQPFDTEIYHRWRRYKMYSTGIVGDLLVHMMTPLIYALDQGWPVRVTASGGHFIDKKMENHDHVNLTIEFEKQHTMIVAGSTCNERGLEVMVRGHEGNLLLGGNNCELIPERIFSDDVDPQTVQCDNSKAQEKLRLNWLSCVRTREQNISQVEFAAKVMVIVDLATRSMWEGGAYTFDPKTMTAATV